MSHASQRDRATPPKGYKEEPAPVADDPHHPHPSQQGIPPPQHLQHPRPGSVQRQHHHPNSPHQSQPHPPAAQGPYASPHPSTHSLPPQHQSPYVGGYPGTSGQAPQDVPYFPAHQSPYSTSSAAGSYTSSETPESMATAAMNRQYPPMYQTPQSASPATVHSPHDPRPLYGPPQPMYYPPYQVPQPAPYGHHPTAQQPTPITTNFTSQPPGPSLSHYTSHPHTPGSTTSPNLKMSQTPLQRPASGLGPGQASPAGAPGSAPGLHQGPAGGAGVNPNAAPGPIPATTPLVVRQDNNGVQWIAFEYSRDRVKMEYTIRCDVESVDVASLPQDFKTENCVYPRACCSKDQYKAQVPHGPHMAGPGGPSTAGVPNTAGLAAGPGPGPSMNMGGSQLHHHHHEHPGGGAPGGGSDVSANHEYSDGTRTHHHQPPNGNVSSPSNNVRQTHNFYPTFPASQNLNSSSLPATHDGGDNVNPHAPSHANAVTASKSEEEDRNVALFGDLPETKRRKFILVDDAQKGTRVRVRVMLDQVNMEEIPDSYRERSAVFPRSYYAVQMQSDPSSPAGSRFPQDDEEGTTGRTLVPVPALDGSEVKVPMPRMNKTKRSKEVTLNDLGYRMSWSQSRVFSGRTLFLQRSLDAYRNKMRSTIAQAGQDVAAVAPHFETRVGKRKWLERSKRTKREPSP